jgi:hypothetical protein
MNRVPMNRVQMAIIGAIGLVVGVIAGGAVFGGDTKTESVTQTTTTVVTKNSGTKTKTVRAGGTPRVKTVTRTITKSSAPYVAPGETTPGGGRTVVQGTKTLTGKDTKNFGTLKLGQDSTLNWTNTGQVFSIISQTQLHVSSTKKKGSIKLYKGSYFNFRVAAVGRWKITIVPR